MSRSRSYTRSAIVGGLLLLAGLFLLTHRPPTAPDPPAATNNSTPDPPTPPSTATTPLLPAEDDLVSTTSTAALSGKLTALLTRPGVRAHEALLLFKDPDGFHRFLTRAASAGVIITGRIDPLRALRVRIRAYDTFAAELVARAADFGGVSANPFIEIPPTPPSAERTASRPVAVGDQLLSTLGVAAGTDTRTWGRGVTIAVLDGGAAPDPTLGARLRYLDIGLGYAGTGEAGQHGTAVAALAAGSAPDRPGVAPAASVLSIRVIDTEDKSDVFTVSQGIVAAVDAGAQLVNLSLGGRVTTELINRAITYATTHGVVIVAAAGNDGINRLAWPAADPRVVSVGATDATGRQAAFSNSGPQLHLTAPGVGILTGGLNPQRTLFSGTSASAPVIAGAIAVILSQTPGLTAPQAVEILQTHANDGGAAGDDPNYGHGTLNLGWALARDDRTRTDTAISSHHYNPETGALEVIVQNRSARASAAQVLTVNLNGRVATYAIPAIAPGLSTAVVLPVDASTAAAPIELRTQLEQTEGVIDAVPANNTHASLFDLRR
ncbi:MAG: S8 family serine peptidase [Opitutus sp.]|nr:S8 family serine peptidase [Opitutus sp.]MCS6248184.1 S8 family serine peptidase [Opitutus sp.]MCS6273438.1 S8 family serine peptidase [Opitutus sp.]MCS6276956.1 S8 family serine peptidase [Opitutus sp.]MCS6299996.1 S8 family serine peptidase [Opitutus sp.]